MNKRGFLTELREGLSGLPQEDIEGRLTFYSEMIDDRMEEGMTEEEAVSAIGSVEDVVSQILADIPLAKLVKEKVKPNRELQKWEIVLLVLGFPLWLSLLLAAAIVILSIYIVIWSLLIVLYAADFSFAAGGIAGIFGSFTYLPSGNIAGAALYVGIGLMCTGIAMLLFFGANQFARGILLLSKVILLRIKSLFIRKEAAK